MLQSFPEIKAFTRTGEKLCWTGSRFLGFVLMLLAVNVYIVLQPYHQFAALLMLGGPGTEFDSTAFILLQTMHHESERERC